VAGIAEPVASSGPLLLVGNRGTGKTTVAQLLSNLLGWHWLDADRMLEKRAGRTIRQLFADGGHAEFRDLEATILAELCGLQRHVVATGGGAVLRAENRRLLRGAGIVVWLKGDPKTLWERMKADAVSAEQRPDLGQGGLTEVEELAAARADLYAQCATFSIDTTAYTPQDVASLIHERLIARTQEGPRE
jgi:shikimate kinase